MSGYLGMSDEDIMKMTGPEPVASETPKTEENKTEVVENPPVEKPAETQPATQEPETTTTESNEKEPPVKEASPAAQTPSTTEPKAVETPEPEPKTDTPVIDYKSEYEQIMAPFKANGEIIKLNSVKDAVQLMQMGANYTKKMQELAPQTKLLRMLTANGLTEDKLSFLIDIDKKNPEAIKKLIKDSGIDPLDIDTTKEPEYREGNHKVTDAEAKFYGVLDELRTNPEGAKTLSVINDQWDQASKEKLWDNPDVMSVIHEQREIGIYDRVAAEVKRQKTLGSIPASTDFLAAYQYVGEQMHKANLFADLVKPAVEEQKPAPIATRPAVKPPAVKSNPKAEAAAPSRSTTQTAQTQINPFAMSDDEIMKSGPPPSR